MTDLKWPLCYQDRPAEFRLPTGDHRPPAGGLRPDRVRGGQQRVSEAGEGRTEAASPLQVREEEEGWELVLSAVSLWHERAGLSLSLSDLEWTSLTSGWLRGRRSWRSPWARRPPCRVRWVAGRRTCSYPGWETTSWWTNTQCWGMARSSSRQRGNLSLVEITQVTGLWFVGNLELLR